MMRIIHLMIAASAAAMIAAPASAQQSTHADIKTVEITDFIGTVKIETRFGGAVRLDRAAGADASYPVIVDVRDGVLMIRSDEDPDDTRWWNDVDWRRHRQNAFQEFLKDYPTLTLAIPEGATLHFESAVISLDADDTNGALFVRGGHVDGVIGDIAMGDIKIDGSGDLETGAVKGLLDIDIHGSGDFAARAALALDAAIQGSGDITVGDVGAEASTHIQGSGDIRLGDIAGPLTARIHGSGDIDAGELGKGAVTFVSGSGDISLTTVNGETAANIQGSGDIGIRDGKAENLKVRIHGSGGFNFGGLATNPDVEAHGSGDIFIRRHEGAVTARGKGDIRISGVDYSDD